MARPCPAVYRGGLPLKLVVVIIVVARVKLLCLNLGQQKTQRNRRNQTHLFVQELKICLTFILDIFRLITGVTGPVNVLLPLLIIVIVGIIKVVVLVVLGLFPVLQGRGECLEYPPNTRKQTRSALLDAHGNVLVVDCQENTDG